jgi:hypothetical protein
VSLFNVWGCDMGEWELLPDFDPLSRRQDIVTHNAVRAVAAHRQFADRPSGISKKRRKTSPGSTAQLETSRASSTAPHPAPAQPKAPRKSNPSTCTASTLAVAGAARERQGEAASPRSTPTHMVEDDAPLLKVLRVGMIWARGHTSRFRKATCAPNLSSSSNPPDDIEKRSPPARGNERRQQLSTVGTATPRVCHAAARVTGFG